MKEYPNVKINTNSHIRIIGIDPGTRYTGVGIIDRIGNQLKFVYSETINISQEKQLDQKLVTIHHHLISVVNRFNPQAASIEQVFHSVNPRSSLLLGHARGVAILTLSLFGIQIHEYAPNEVKSAVTGVGRASKDQVAAMVQVLLNLNRNKKLKEDEADALANAICHANTQSLAIKKIG